MKHDTTTPEGLKEARAALGMTQSALGAILGVHWTTVARWEAGQPMPERATRFVMNLLMSEAGEAP